MGLFVYLKIENMIIVIYMGIIMEFIVTSKEFIVQSIGTKSTLRLSKRFIGNHFI